MSIKIFDAFVLDMPIAKVIPFLKECVKTLTPEVKKKLNDGMSDMLYSMAIDAALQKRTADQMMKAYIPFTVKESRIKTLSETIGYDPPCAAYILAREWAEHNEFVIGRFDVNDKFNVSLNVSLFPCGNKTYGMTFGDADLVAALLKLPGFRDYSYWNHVDRPEHVTPQEWASRGRVWKKVSPLHLPVADGVQYILFPTSSFMYPWLSDTAMEKYVVSNREAYVQREVKDRLMEMSLEGRTNLTVTECLDASRDAKKEMEEKTPRALSCLETVDKLVPRSWEECKEILRKTFYSQPKDDSEISQIQE